MNNNNNIPRVYEPKMMDYAQSYANAHQAQKNADSQIRPAQRRTESLRNNHNNVNNVNNNNMNNNMNDKQAETIVNKVPSSGIASVKGVLSGDTVLLSVKSNVRGQPDAEKQLTISGVQAPRVGRGKNGIDEPYAWESREFLRNLLIGKRVQYNVTFSTKTNKEFGVILLENKNVSEIIASNGWVNVAPGTARKDGSIHPERQALLDLKNAAETNNLGIWNNDTPSEQHIRKLDWNVESRSLKFFNTNKNQVLEAVLDKVIDGSTVRLEVLTDKPLHHIMLTLHLAGVQCPKVPFNNDEPIPPFALAAKSFVETRLLHHKVGVVLQGVDKFGNFFGSLQFSKGNITLELLRNGLGKYVPWSGELTPIADTLEKTELTAKQHRYNLWRNEKVSNNKTNSITTKHFQGKVVQIVSGDTIVVNVNGTPRKVFLSSVVAPRLGYAKRQDAGEPWAQEAKEFLRKRLIGKKVKLLVEYNRLAPPTAKDQSQRVHCAVYQGKSNANVAEVLVSAGLATVVRHRPNEPRSMHYETLLQTEEHAKNNKKGIHGDNPPKPHPIVDLTERYRVDNNDPQSREKSEHNNRIITAKAKQYFPFLQKEHNLRGIVEYVFNGSRLKILIPNQHCYISFILAGVRTPLGARGKEAAEPYSNEATEFTRKLCMQHDVRINVESLDRGSNFIGSLYIGNHNLALMLVENGLASVFQSYNERPGTQELLEAEERARTAKLNIWKNWKPPSEIKADDTKTSESVEDTTEMMLNVKVTEVIDGANFFVHIVGNKAVETIEQEMKIYGETASSLPPLTTVKKGLICAGLFSDNQWYRVRVEAREGDLWQVNFIDYGNGDLLPQSSLRELTNPGLKAAAPAAKHCTLACLKAPALHDENYEPSADRLYDLIWDKPLLCKVHLREGATRIHVTIYHKDSPDSINIQQLRNGLVRIKKRYNRSLHSIVQELSNVQADAQDKRVGIWRYGVVSDPEEAENDFMFQLR